MHRPKPGDRALGVHAIVRDVLVVCSILIFNRCDYAHNVCWVSPAVDLTNIVAN